MTESRTIALIVAYIMYMMCHTPAPLCAMEINDLSITDTFSTNITIHHLTYDQSHPTD